MAGVSPRRNAHLSAVLRFSLFNGPFMHLPRLLGWLICIAVFWQAGGAIAKQPDHAPAKSAVIKQSDAAIESWPQFRGPDGQGHAAGRGLPIRWTDKKNVVWKIPVKGAGWSSPVVEDNVVWMTTAVVSDHSLRVLCFDFQTGALLRDVEVFHKETLGNIHPKNSHATPTPLLVGNRCFLHFGSHGTAALSREGEILWKTDVKYYHHHGPASSPVFVDNSLFIPCDGLIGPFYDERQVDGAGDPQSVVSLDAATGRERWRIRRAGAHSYSTPLVIDVEGQTQIVSPGGKRVVAYEPSTGNEIWSYSHEGYSVVPRPVYGSGLVFFCTGYDSPTLVALRPNGQGDVTNTHVAWKSNQAVPFNPSPILIGDELYTISDQGVLSCYDAGTGKSHWRKRLGGNYSSSPIYADGKLYVIDEMGCANVISPGVKYKVLAKNMLRAKTLASPAVYGRSLLIRTENQLYRIEDAGLEVDNVSEAENPADEAAESIETPK